MRGKRILALGLLLVVATGCGIGKKAAGGLQPAAPVTTPSTAASHLVTGRAMDARNMAISGVAVGLKATTAASTCASCGFYSGVTSAIGIYSIRVPDGVYVAACNAGTLTCRFTALPTEATVKVTVSGTDLTADLVISAPGGDPTPVPTQPDDSGTTVSGHVYSESGRPVANATVEFRMVGCPNCMPQPWTTTDASGAYSIDLNGGVYNATCEDPFNCGPKGGDGGPFPVTVPPSRTLDFIACNSVNDYPACLRK